MVVARGLAAEPHRYERALCALDHTGGLAAGAASRRTCAVRLRPTFFPLNNIVFAPPQKLLMRLARIKRACCVRPNAETSVANAAVMGVARWVQGVRRSLRYRGAEVILGLKGVRA